jgi:ankyrin repeat protein
MNRLPRRNRVVLLTLLLLAGIGAGVGLWVRALMRQDALNRTLIVALTHNDARRALSLVNAGADPNTLFRTDPPPSFLQLLQQLLHRAPMLDGGKQTALELACGAPWDDPVEDMAQFRADDATLVEAMLKHGATVNVSDKLGWSPLMYAVMIKHRKMMSVLLEHGANVDTRDNVGRTPLMEASTDDDADEDLVRLLLEHGADTGLQDTDGWTALHFAVFHENDDIIRLLLSHGANPNVAAKSGATPASLAQNRQRPDLVALLKQANAKQKGQERKP